MHFYAIVFNYDNFNKRNILNKIIINFENENFLFNSYSLFSLSGLLYNFLKIWIISLKLKLKNIEKSF